MFHVEQSSFGIYIHVPFCKSKCGYCDFCRVTDLSLVDGCLAVLSEEIARSPVAGSRPKTVYVGGGTPSVLGAQGVDKLLKIVNERLDLSAVEEFTVECNPDDVSDELSDIMASAGVDRVSMGAQSLQNGMLRFLGRRHTADRVSKAIDSLRRAEIVNISVDCIFGLPELDGYEAEADFRRFVDLGVEHLSAYALSYESGSRFSRMVANGSLVPLCDDAVADQYQKLTEVMASAGYCHYEISNYAKPGREAKHNSSYWNGTPYWGFGPAAASYYGGIRETNVADVAEYVRSDGRRKAFRETLSAKDVYDETVMLRLRTSRGLAIDEIPTDMRSYFKRKSAGEVAVGNLERTKEGRLRIPEKRWFISDGIIERLFAE